MRKRGEIRNGTRGNGTGGDGMGPWKHSGAKLYYCYCLAHCVTIHL